MTDQGLLIAVSDFRWKNTGESLGYGDPFLDLSREQRKDAIAILQAHAIQEKETGYE